MCLLRGWGAQVRRVDGVLPSGVLSSKYHVAWTRSGRLVLAKLGTYTIPYLYVPRGARPAIHS